RQKGWRAVAVSDWDLVQRTRSGDREAFRELVERYQRKIAALALGMLRNREDALDVVQDTFAKAYQSLDRFKGDASFYTWVYRIAYNLCVDHQRRDAKQPHVPLEGEEGGDGPVRLPDAPRFDQTFERARDAEIGQRVRAAISE